MVALSLVLGLDCFLLCVCCILCCRSRSAAPRAGWLLLRGCRASTATPSSTWSACWRSASRCASTQVGVLHNYMLGATYYISLGSFGDMLLRFTSSVRYTAVQWLIAVLHARHAINVRYGLVDNMLMTQL